jgi:hypothetical protein
LKRKKTFADPRPPHNPNHILKGPDDEEKDIVELPRKKSKTSTWRKMVIEDIEDEEDLRRSPPPPNPNHVLEGPDDVIEVHSDVPEKPAESAEAELSKSYLSIESLCLPLCAEQLSKKWTVPVYVLFRLMPRIEYVDSHRVHVFECAAKHCKGKHGRGVRRFLDKGDEKSTGGLHRHAKICWEEETVKAAINTKDLGAARTILGDNASRDGSITAAFERIGKGKVSYSHRQHEYPETRLEGIYLFVYSSPDQIFVIGLRL